VTVVFTTEPHLLMRMLMPLSEADTAAKLHALLKAAERGQPGRRGRSRRLG